MNIYKFQLSKVRNFFQSYGEVRGRMNFDQVKDNTGHVKCPFPNCNTKVIPYTESLKQSIAEICNAPSMVNIEDTSSSNTHFFQVQDMWDFDNIGVSRPLGDHKDFRIDDKVFDIERLLICSECDKGPIGFAGHFQEDQNKSPQNLLYFLSCNSMKYQID